VIYIVLLWKLLLWIIYPFSSKTIINVKGCENIQEIIKLGLVSGFYSLSGKRRM
jgi:hypothetical protein